MTKGLSVELKELIELKRYANGYSCPAKTTQAGVNLSPVRGRGMDFSEVRNYQAGDEIRHMEWRITARTGKPHIKLYQEERERPVVLMVDFSPSMFFGTRLAFKSVVAARLAALLAWTAIKQGDRVGGIIYSAESHQEFMPRGRDLGVLPLLSSLSKLSQENRPSHQTTDMANALQKLRRVVKPGSIVVLISDFYSLNKACEAHLSRLRAQNDLLMYHICDPLELSAPKPGTYAITDGISEMLLDTQFTSVKETYNHYCDKRIQDLKESCRQQQIPYYQVLAELDLPGFVRQTFPKRRAHG